MKTIASLKRDAGVVCKNRKHVMGVWKVIKADGGQNVQQAICLKCLRPCVVMDRPRANEVEISGAAVALNCEGVTATVDTIPQFHSRDEHDYHIRMWADKWLVKEFHGRGQWDVFERSTLASARRKKEMLLAKDSRARILIYAEATLGGRRVQAFLE